jgi:hypothetical protein
MSTRTTIYRPSLLTGKRVKSHARLVRLDEHKKPFVVMDGKRAYLKKVRNEEAMVVTKTEEGTCCEICGRLLTAEESIERGIGPVCARC